MKISTVSGAFLFYESCRSCHLDKFVSQLTVA